MPPYGGLIASARRLLATAFELLGVRLELLGTELEGAKRRLLASLLWSGIGLILVGVGVLLACTFALILSGEQYRLMTAAVLAMLFLTAGTLFLRYAWRRLSGPGSIFALSLKELAKDGAMPGKDRRHDHP